VKESGGSMVQKFVIQKNQKNSKLENGPKVMSLVS